MDFKFSKDSSEEEAQASVPEKGRQTGLLVLLLVLLGGFGYLYFFTGLIRPQEQAPAPQPPPQVVKQPLPARDAVAPAADTTKPAEQKPQSATVATTGTPQQKTAPVKPPVVVPKPAPAPPITAKSEVKKPVAQPPSAKVEQAKAGPVPAVKKVEPPKPAAKTATTGTAKKPVAAKPVDQQQTVAKAPAVKKPHSVKKQPVVKAGGPWTVVVGLYVVEETLAADISKVKKAGLNPIMTTGSKRPVSMNRLLVGTYASKSDAQRELDKVQQAGGSGFLVQHGDKHEVFAGSYAVLSGAIAEQQRLAAAGVKVSIKKVQVPLASRKLTAGTFTDRKAAEETMKKLKASGIGTPVLE